MNNQFSQRVSDIIVYSKEEANRLRSRYIGPEHLLLGMLRDGEGKAIEILSKLNTNLTIIKQQIEAQLKAEADDMLLPDAEVPLSNDAAKILKMCILEARGMKSNIADTEHVLLAILREKKNHLKFTYACRRKTLMTVTTLHLYYHSYGSWSLHGLDCFDKLWQVRC